MRLIGGILLAAFVLAALRAAVAVLLLAVLLVVLVVLVTAPARTLSTLFGFVLLNAFATYPLVGLVVCALVLAMPLVKH